MFYQILTNNKVEAAGIEPELSTTHREDDKELRSAFEVLGGNWEDGEITDWHRMAGIDPGLSAIIKVWHTLPEAIRKEVAAMCLERGSRDISISTKCPTTPVVKLS